MIVSALGIRFSWKPHGATRLGWPVKLVTPSVLKSPAGARYASTPDKAEAISRISIVRSLWARMYSTTGIRRAARKLLGHACGPCSTNSSSRSLQVNSSKAAALSAKRIVIIGHTG